MSAIDRQITLLGEGLLPKQHLRSASQPEETFGV